MAITSRRDLYKVASTLISQHGPLRAILIAGRRAKQAADQEARKNWVSVVEIIAGRAPGNDNAPGRR